MRRNPSIRSVDILVWIYKNCPERFTMNDILEEYPEMKHGEVTRRVNYMIHNWGAVKKLGEIEAHKQGRRKIAYCLTDWGYKYDR